MIEKPAIPDDLIVARLRDGYGLSVTQVTFLPLGFDLKSAVYRVEEVNGTPYFLKLRGGVFDETTVTLPKFLNAQGITQVMASIPTITGQLWISLGDMTMILYPFIKSHNGFEVDLSEHQWIELGMALKGIHTIGLPPEFLRQIQPETYSPHWRETVMRYLVNIGNIVYDDSVAIKLATFLKSKHAEIQHIITGAEKLAAELKKRPLEFVLCHTDIHGGNVMIGENGDLFIVDWDNPLMAPKERDLMFVTGGVGGIWYKSEAETLFYQGYGRTEIDPVALAYYRYERIVQDAAEFCKHIFETTRSVEDREQGLQFFIDSFLPDNAVDMANKSGQYRC